jgi:hypothetical protein
MFGAMARVAPARPATRPTKKKSMAVPDQAQLTQMGGRDARTTHHHQIAHISFLHQQRFLLKP